MIPYNKILPLALAVLGCSLSANEPKLVDPLANEQTKALFQNLSSIAPESTLFGHQATLAYGYRWYGEEGRSDVKETSGSYPALYGWDFGGIEIESEDDPTRSEYHSYYEDMLRWSKEAFARGGVVTYAWHMANPVSGESFYEKTPAMHTIVPGGENHEAYKRALDRMAGFLKAHGDVPVILRPFHEHNGDWFWWGKGFASEEDYITVWRFTVDYLKDEKGVHNVLYAFSPDRSRMDLGKGEASYLYAYPGDDYVDIFGLDNYWDVGHPANRASADERKQDFVNSLELLVNLAEKHGKLPALTETGLDTLEDPKWWTETLLAGINANQTTRRIAYVQVWRNANREREGKDHFYVPYPGHPSEPDFVAFKEDPSILFEDELPDLYLLKKAGE